MKKILFTGIFIISALITQSCDRELIRSEFPNVITLSAVDQGENLLFSGELKNDENILIDEVGFIWQSNDDPFSKPGFRIKSEKSGLGKFTSEISWSISKNKNYIMRAYARCGDKMIFGEKLDF